MSNYKPDSGIPILTEIIDTPADEHLAPAAHEAVAADLPPSPSAIPSVPPEEELRRIEHEISERVLQQILARIDFVLEQRVRDSFADVLQLSVDRVTTDLRSGLQHSLAEVITRAVTQEISRLQSARK
jgi:hypothetical protein